MHWITALNHDVLAMSTMTVYAPATAAIHGLNSRVVVERMGYSRHGGETADIDAEVRDLLIRGRLRLLDEDEARYEEYKERHGESAHTGGADLLSTQSQLLLMQPSASVAAVQSWCGQFQASW